MLFIAIGVILLLLKVAGIAPVAEWSWLYVLAPFGLAAAWWAYADASGLTKKREIDRMEARKEARRHKAMEAIGTLPKNKKK